MRGFAKAATSYLSACNLAEGPSRVVARLRVRAKKISDAFLQSGCNECSRKWRDLIRYAPRCEKSRVPPSRRKAIQCCSGQSSQTDIRSKICVETLQHFRFFKDGWDGIAPPRPYLRHDKSHRGA